MTFLVILLVIGFIFFLLKQWFLLTVTSGVFVLAVFAIAEAAENNSRSINEFFDFDLGSDPKHEEQMHDEIRQDVNRARRNLDKKGVKY